MKKLSNIILLSSLIYFLQSFEGITGLSLKFYFKDVLKLTESNIMWIGTLLTGCWCIKPLYGIIIDSRFNKKGWIAASLIGSVFIAGLVGILNNISIIYLIGLLTILNLTYSWRDVAVDGLCCVDGKRYKITGKIQASQEIVTSVTAILSGLFGGYLASHFKYNISFVCLIPAYIFILFIVIFKYQEKIQPKKTIIAEFKKFIMIIKNKRILWICLFMFLWVYSPGFETPLFFIETNVFHWTAQFLGILQAISAGFAIIAGMIYYKYSKKVKIEKLMYISVFLGTITTICYLYYTPISAIIYDFIFSFVGTIISLCMLDWMAQNTTKGAESTCFALMASVYNLSNLASSASGAFLFPKIGLQNLIILSSAISLSSLLVIKKVLK